MKIKSLLALAAAAFAFTACVDDGGNEYHSTSFYPMTTSGIQCFADQTVDSVRVISYDSWSLTNTCSWMSISENGRPAPFTVTIPAGYSSSNRLDIQLQPNTTGRQRRDLISVVSSFGKIGTVSQTITRVPLPQRHLAQCQVSNPKRHYYLRLFAQHRRSRNSGRRHQKLHQSQALCPQRHPYLV